MKPDRLSVIASICNRSGKKGIPAHLKTRLITERVTERHAKSQDEETVDQGTTNDSILDEGANVDLISPMLARATSGEFEGHSRDERGFLLSKAERQQVADDVWRFRHPVGLWLALPAARLTA